MLEVLPFPTVMQLWIWWMQLKMIFCYNLINAILTQACMVTEIILRWTVFPLLFCPSAFQLTSPVQSPTSDTVWWMISQMQNLCHCEGNRRKFNSIKKRMMFLYSVITSSLKANVLYSWTFSQCCSIHINKEQFNNIQGHHPEP